MPHLLAHLGNERSKGEVFVPWIAHLLSPQDLFPFGYKLHFLGSIPTICVDFGEIFVVKIKIVL